MITVVISMINVDLFHMSTGLREAIGQSEADLIMFLYSAVCMFVCVCVWMKYDGHNYQFKHRTFSQFA